MKYRPIYLFFAAAFIFVPLAALAYLGTFTRFYADDFCIAADVTQVGVWGTLIKWYANWTGRFSYLLGAGVLGSAGPGAVGWLQILVLIVWLGIGAWAIFPVFQRAGWRMPAVMSLLASGFAILVVLSSTPNRFQSFYWQDGMVNYTLPLIGLTISAGIILHTWLASTRLLPATLGVFISALITGGFTEIASALQVSLLLLASGMVFWLGGATRYRRLVVILAAALAGALVAVLIVIPAPGNQVRLATNGAEPDLARVVLFSIRNSVIIIAKYFLWTPGWGFISAAVPFLAGWWLSAPKPAAPPRITWRSLWAENWFRGAALALPITFLLVNVTCAPVVFALNAYPDERTIIVPQYLLVSSAVATSALLGFGLRQLGILPGRFGKLLAGRVFPAAILACLLLACVSVTLNTVRQAPDFQASARAWDERAAIFRRASRSGQTDVLARGLDARFGIGDLNGDSGFWINGCMARFYGLLSVSGN
jgi:hypothetical protein